MFYGIAPNDKGNDHLFDDLYFVSDEYNGANRDNTGTVRPRHTRYFPGGLWQMIIENGILLHSLAALLVRKGILKQEEIDAEMDRLYDEMENFDQQ